MEKFIEYIVTWGVAYINLIERPLIIFLEVIEEPVDRRFWFWFYDIIVTIILLSICSKIFELLKKLIKKLLKRSDYIDKADYDAYIRKDNKFVDSLDAAKNPASTIQPLIAAKRYDRVALIYSSLNQPREAAKWFRKAKDKRNEAIELAKAGETTRAARLLMREGDYETAVRFFEEQGEYAQAAVAYSHMGAYHDAAEAFIMAEKPGKAAKAFLEFFKNSKLPHNDQLKVAQTCYNLLDDEQDSGNIKPSIEEELMAHIALCFDKAMWFYLAGSAYLSGKHYKKAIDAFRSVPSGDPNYQSAQKMLKKCYGAGSDRN